MSSYQTGGIAISGSLAGTETVVVGNGGPQITTATTQQIADLAAHNLTTLTVGTLTVTGTATLSTTQVALLSATQTGALGITGTVTVNGTTHVTVNVGTITANSVVSFGLKTVGGTPAPVFMGAVTPGTSFEVASSAGNTSTYNYQIQG